MTESRLDALNHRLRSVAGLTREVSDSLSGLIFQERRLEAGDLLYPPGSSELPCYILLEGAATRFKMKSDGTRAIVAFELPGDIINLEALLLRHIDCGVTAATDCSLAVVERGVMTAAWTLEPGLEAALWRYAFVKAAALEEWLLNIGKRSPTGRVAHLLMELRSRLDLAHEHGRDDQAVHATTNDVADAMGLQPVVATRILHDLASRGLITREQDRIVINDAAGLARIGEFRPDYLHLAR